MQKILSILILISAIQFALSRKIVFRGHIFANEKENDMEKCVKQSCATQSELCRNDQNCVSTIRTCSQGVQQNDPEAHQKFETCLHENASSGSLYDCMVEKCTAKTQMNSQTNFMKTHSKMISQIPNYLSDFVRSHSKDDSTVSCIKQNCSDQISDCQKDSNCFSTISSCNTGVTNQPDTYKQYKTCLEKTNSHAATFWTCLTDHCMYGGDIEESFAIFSRLNHSI